MKTSIIIISLFLSIFNSSAQNVNQCIKIEKLDVSLFTIGRTEVSETTFQKAGLLVTTTKNDKEYNFLISKEQSFNDINITKGSRITFYIEGNNKFIAIATPSLDGHRVDVRRYKICNNMKLN